MSRKPSAIATSVFEKPDASVDVVLLTLSGGKLTVLLGRRDREPEMGVLVLPGGYIHVSSVGPNDVPDADTDATARRVLHQKLGIQVPYLEQLYTFSGLERDHRGWSISVAYYALVHEDDLASRDPETTALVDVDELPDLPFDHAQQIEMAVKRIRGKAFYSNAPLFLLGPEFRIADAEQVYRDLLGTRGLKMDKASFRRFILEQDVLEPIPGREVRKPGEAGRPSQLYRMKGPLLDEFDRPVLSARTL
jgi:8-oxo-dGTP diphosphatase